jgi:hypothetical protein
MISVVDIVSGDLYFDLMMPHTKNREDLIHGYCDMDLQQVSTEPVTINKLFHFSKIYANTFFL